MLILKIFKYISLVTTNKFLKVYMSHTVGFCNLAIGVVVLIKILYFMDPLVNLKPATSEIEMCKIFTFGPNFTNHIYS